MPRGVSRTDPFLSVVLPCRNQADHIQDVLRRYRAPLAFTGRRHELVVVPNACSDRTPELVRELARDDPAIRVVDNPQGGWGLSVRTGLAAARGEVLCYTNSARTDPARVGDLLRLYLLHAPCLAKVRREHRAAPARVVGSWLYNCEARLLFGLPVPDVNGTPKMLARDLYEKLDLFSDGDLLDLEVLVKAQRLGVPLVELPVRGFQRHGGKSSTGLKSAWTMYAGAWRLRRRLAGFRPLQEAS